MDEYESLVKWFDENGYRLRFRHWRYPTVFSVKDVDFTSVRDSSFRDYAVQSPGKRLERYYRRHSLPWNNWTPYPKGGLTECEVEKQDAISQEWEQVTVGYGKCMLIDNFCYKDGREWAMKDAYHTITGEEYAIE